MLDGVAHFVVDDLSVGQRDDSLPRGLHAFGAEPVVGDAMVIVGLGGIERRRATAISRGRTRGAARSSATL